MNELLKRKCLHCGAEYSNIYSHSADKRYSYTQPTTYCSKSCASKARLNNNPGCIQPAKTKDELLSSINAAIDDAGRYLTTTDVMKRVKVSSKTLTKHNISVVELNRERGYDRPASAFQESVGEILSDILGEVETEKSFVGLEGSTGHPLRVDFHVVDTGVVVEADGVQHLDKDHPWSNTNPNGSVQQYDRIKDEFFDSKGYRVIRIPYKRNVTKDYVLRHLEF